MSDFLQQMARHSAERAAQAGTISSDELDRPIVPLVLGEFDVIAEIKGRSPAEGKLADAGLDRPAQASTYAEGGAAAISVLTEPSRFDGSLAHLEEVVAAVPNTPIMRKDFLVEPIQVLEARKAGASGVLLIATMLSDAHLRVMLDIAYEHQLFVLLECFDEQDLDRVDTLLDYPPDADQAAAGKLLVGINTRNLRTLEVDNDRLTRLSSLLPDARCVAESGFHTADDAAAAAALGYRLALVGTALMRSKDPAGLVKACVRPVRRSLRREPARENLWTEECRGRRCSRRGGRQRGRFRVRGIRSPGVAWRSTIGRRPSARRRAKSRRYASPIERGMARGAGRL